MLVDGDLVEVDTAVLEGEGDFQIDEARAARTTRVQSGVPLALSVALNPDPAEPGEILLSELTVSNGSASALFNVQVQLEAWNLSGGLLHFERQLVAREEIDYQAVRRDHQVFVAIRGVDVVALTALELALDDLRHGSVGWLCPVEFPDVLHHVDDVLHVVELVICDELAGPGGPGAVV